MLFAGDFEFKFWVWRGDGHHMVDTVAAVILIALA